MTLSLYVLRHAKAASEAPPGGGDHERPLRPRGKRAAREVGRFLTRLAEVPQLILSSTAARARATAELAGDEGGWDSVPLRLSRAIYEAAPEALLGVIKAGGVEADRLLLVGHQPGLSQLIAELTGSEPAFPTAALARIDFELERWDELRGKAGRLVWLVTPETIGVAVKRGRVRDRGE
jgi:phosphohistidine phosphatase